MPNRRELGYVSSWNTVLAGSEYGIATGGSSSSITDGDIPYTLLSFTTDGTLTVTQSGLFDVLLIGGGGGSGGNPTFGESTGGGGGGSVLITTLYLPVASYTVDVGAGGPGGNHQGSGDALPREFGRPSVLYDATGATTRYYALAEGGGGGAGAWEAQNANGLPVNLGGSSWRSGSFAGGAASSTSPLCFAGGGAFSTSGNGAGGGAGAGGNGGTGTSTAGGTGGAGRTTTFTGASVTYGSGGAGGGNSAGATGSAIGGGGGGRALSSSGTGTAGNAGAIYVRFRV